MDTNPEAAPEQRAQELVEGITEVFSDADFDESRSRFEDLMTLAENHPDNESVQTAFAAGLVRSAQFEALVDGETVRSRVDRLRELAEEHTDNTAIRTARVAGEAIAAAAEGEFESLRSRLDDLDELVEAHGEDPNVRLVTAAALQSAIYHENEAGNQPAVDSNIDRALDLADEYPDDPNVKGAITVADMVMDKGSLVPSSPAGIVRAVVGPEVGLVFGLATAWSQTGGKTTLAMGILGVGALAALVNAVFTYRSYYAGDSAPPGDKWPWGRLFGFVLWGAIGAGLYLVGTVLL